MISLEKFKFENSELIEFSVTDSCLEMMLEDVSVKNSTVKACITVMSIRSIFVDGEPLIGTPVAGQSGEVLKLDISDDTLSMVIVWVDYSRPGNDKYFTKEYLIFGNILVTQI